MKTLGLFFGLACVGMISGVAHATTAYQTEYQRAIQGIQNNILSNGAIVASPSQTDPDYYYNWVRDTSLTMRAVVTLAYDSTTAADLQANLLPRIDNWINWELGLQVTPKLTDLGEPRFYVTGLANNEPWGRPQNDGPASRAITAMLIANNWINNGRIADVEARLYKAEIPATTLIKRDLEYVANHWQDQSFDLWEEEKGMHFYTLTVQKVALLKGAALATRMGDGGAASFYSSQATAIDQYLGQFWDASTNTIRYALPSPNKLTQKTTNLDIAVVLAAIETFDGQFYVNVDQLTSTVKALITSFTSEYKLNLQTKTPSGTNLGPVLGRYPGDIYSGADFGGGNPWFLSTLAIAEFYCDVNKAQNHTAAQAQFDSVLYHMTPDGSLSEQFNNTTGFEQGAHDLTWSYTAYVTAYRACF